MRFQNFYKTLLTQTVESKKLNVFGETKNIIGMASYKTISKLVYTKIVFEDRSFLYVIPRDEEVYYSAQYITDTGIPDADLGVKQDIEFEGKTYHLDQKDENQFDYQYVTQLHIGDIRTIEGECKFCDYMPDQGDDFLSLGWVMYTGKRADIHPSLIDLKEIEII